MRAESFFFLHVPFRTAGLTASRSDWTIRAGESSQCLPGTCFASTRRVCTHWDFFFATEGHVGVTHRVSLKVSRSVGCCIFRMVSLDLRQLADSCVARIRPSPFGFPDVQDCDKSPHEEVADGGGRHVWSDIAAATTSEKTCGLSFKSCIMRRVEHTLAWWP